MQEARIYEQLTAIFRDLFDDENLVIGPETSPADIETWDSMNHINLLVAIEGRFGIRLSANEIESLENVGSIVKLIEAKTAGN